MISVAENSIPVKKKPKKQRSKFKQFTGLCFSNFLSSTKHTECKHWYFFSEIYLPDNHL